MSFEAYNPHLLLIISFQMFHVSRIDSFYTLACYGCQHWWQNWLDNDCINKHFFKLFFFFFPQPIKVLQSST